MCGRYVTVSSPTLLAERFDVTELRPRRGDLEPNYNVAPRADVPVVAERHGERVLDLRALGSGAVVGQGPLDRRPPDQRRGEKLTTSNAFKRAFERRRCIVPADGFYEWQADRGTAARKQPWFFRRRDGEPLAFAGLWEIWHDPVSATTRRAFVRARSSRPSRTNWSRRSTTGCRSRFAEASWDTWLDVDNRDTDDADATARARCRPTSSRRGPCRRS